MLKPMHLEWQLLAFLGYMERAYYDVIPLIKARRHITTRPRVTQLSYTFPNKLLFHAPLPNTPTNSLIKHLSGIAEGLEKSNACTATRTDTHCD